MEKQKKIKFHALQLIFASILFFSNCITTKDIGDRMEFVELSNTKRYTTIYKKKPYFADDWSQDSKNKGILTQETLKKEFNQKIKDLKLAPNEENNLTQQLNQVFSTGHYHSCTESPGPGTITKDISLTADTLKKLEFEKLTSEENQKLALTYKESLATLYTVSEIIQFGQNSLFRLCESRGNGDFTADDYRTNFTLVLKSMVDLLKEAKKK
ncbi:hypothetical protein EHQ68_11075 [Leptospira congkakensis]|uniref:Uncharacterized protein n=1 Tax=Leptospira congkakensis TaxID=2484932 RepID=A0A4Z1AA03_9LEPT|nr:hypothetical protein [Leptospira congkakensis]TGL88354.1 hypothetical protein EHQ68_11075 [Leptospira congkakensis]TGL95459.1 hypothetical protein EHQ69_03260 [Leptospira congkakensis]TGL96541.1 hypothetical protein EHQ70_10310 [Leptospira congkakensis]